MLDLGNLELSDEHVRLRLLAPADAEALAAAAAEGRDQYRFTDVPDGTSAAAKYIDRALRAHAAGQRHPFAVVFDGRVVGSTSYYDYQPWHWPEGAALARVDRPDALEIGHTWLAASAQRTACNTAAKILLLAQAFESFQVHRVALRTDARNLRSRAAIERLGATFDGVLRAHTAGADGQVRDTAYYSILAAEWPAVKTALTATSAHAR
jgi:RimJ/RimL family protein N-acetyltransferase